MISKELLGEVLDASVYELKIEGNTVYPIYDNGMPLMNDIPINIYELAHRCKEWALKKDKYKWLFSYKAFIDCWCDIVDNHNRKNIIMSFRADTEPEAIFKATSYIMEQLKQKD